MAWKYVAEDYAPFDIDVTTIEPPTDYFSGNGGGRAIRVVFSSRWDDGRINGGVDDNDGTDWVNNDNLSGLGAFQSWGDSEDIPVWVFANGFDTVDWSPLPDPVQEYIGTIASHEVGHGFGLNHDGDSSAAGVLGEYYQGHGEQFGETSWGPIMGGAELRNLTQWSKGQYVNATQTQDDIAIITGINPVTLIDNNVTLRNDDHSNVRDGSATRMSFIHNTIATKGGIISGSEASGNNDIDVFRFDAGPSSVDISINVDPVAVGPNLDVGMKVYDPNGTLVWNLPGKPSGASADPDDSISASYAFNGSGEYYIEVDGVNSDPLNNNSDYGSLGQYSVRVVLGIGAPRVVNLELSNAATGAYRFSRVSGTGEQLRTVPVANVNKVSIAFSEPVNSTELEASLTLTKLDALYRGLFLHCLAA